MLVLGGRWGCWGLNRLSRRSRGVLPPGLWRNLVFGGGEGLALRLNWRGGALGGWGPLRVFVRSGGWARGLGNWFCFILNTTADDVGI